MVKRLPYYFKWQLLELGKLLQRTVRVLHHRKRNSNPRACELCPNLYHGRETSQWKITSHSELCHKGGKHLCCSQFIDQKNILQVIWSSAEQSWTLGSSHWASSWYGDDFTFILQRPLPTIQQNQFALSLALNTSERNNMKSWMYL